MSRNWNDKSKAANKKRTRRAKNDSPKAPTARARKPKPPSKQLGLFDRLDRDDDRDS